MTDGASASASAGLAAWWMRVRRVDYWIAGLRPYFVLSLLVFFTAVPGIFKLAPVDRDEARFMQATKQMVETGDFAHILFQDVLRDRKPPGTHWVQAAAVKAFAGGKPDVIAAYRVPGVIAVWLAVLATFATGRAVAGPKTGLLAGIVLATSALVAIEAHLAKADALLFGLSAVCFGVTMLAYTRAPGKPLPLPLAAAFWSALGFSVLIKGPVLVIVFVTAVIGIAIADHGAKWIANLRPAPGIFLAAGVIAIWPLVTGWDEAARLAATAVREDLLPKLAGARESHGAPPGSHALATMVTFWPWAATLPLIAWNAWTQRDRPAVRYCLAWLIPFWLLLELTPTKLPHYVLPVFPALALLAAVSIEIPLSKAPRTVRALGYTAVSIHVAIALLVLAGFAAVNASGYLNTIPIGGAMALAVTAAAGVPLARWGIQVAVWRVALCIAIIFSVLFGSVLPQIGALNVSRRLADVIAAQDSALPAVLVGYHEPSAVFLLGTDTKLTGSAEAVAALVEGRAEVVAISQENLIAVLAGVESAGKNLTRIAEISGYNYGRGAQVTLIVLRVQSTGGPADNE
ncbi:MAG: glycosyltransferase family 39 protein [Rhodobacteraceae bacterium]|nr:glycosyltransferase family 39 protein [Paracoccaceae bacterium]